MEENVNRNCYKWCKIAHSVFYKALVACEMTEFCVPFSCRAKSVFHWHGYMSLGLVHALRELTWCNFLNESGNRNSRFDDARATTCVSIRHACSFVVVFVWSLSLSVPPHSKDEYLQWCFTRHSDLLCRFQLDVRETLRQQRNHRRQARSCLPSLQSRSIAVPFRLDSWWTSFS